MNATYRTFYQQADKFFVGITAGLLIVSLLLANWYSSWAAALLIGVPAFAVPLAISRALPASRLSRIAFAISLMIFAALHIHQAHGMIEMHFGIFVLLALLLYYRDPLPILVAAATIAVHHLLFNYLQEGGASVWIFENRTGFNIVMIHAVFVVIEAAALIYLARKSRNEFQQNSELADIGEHISQQGEVDLTFQVHNPQGKFTRAFNEFFALMNELVGQAGLLSQKINDIGDEFARTTQDMSSGAHKQHEETDLIATATTQMTASMAEINNHSRQAAEAAQSANDVSQESEQSITAARSTIGDLANNIDRANEVIQNLDSESNNIGSVLSVIQGIAEQTNLLALNAAIEAARAGEQGRGFAVVADEVRTLASRTHESTEEIQRMIERLQKGSSEAVGAMETSKTGVHSSVEQITLTSERLQIMRDSVADIYRMNQQIAHALEEQSSAVSEVNGNLSTIRDISETTTEQANRANQNAGQLVTMASDLRGLLTQFKV